MVLCMIPVSFAASYDGSMTVTNQSYNLTVFSWEHDLTGAVDLEVLETETNANSITAEYNYEEMDEDTTGMFTRDSKMAIVKVEGWNDVFAGNNVSNIEVTIDGQRVEANELAEYAKGFVGYKPDYNAIYFPIELTKAGYSDSYLVELSADVKTNENGNDIITEWVETAKISIKMVNNAAYKNSKTAYIQNIESNSRDLDAYIVGDKIYLDWVPEDNYEGWYSQTVDITFKDNNGRPFSDVTWAYQVKNDAGVVMMPVAGQEVKKTYGKKLNDDSAVEFNIHTSVDASEIKFTLEDSSSIYETQEYEVVQRYNIVEADPMGIYFADESKTIKVGESYTPVVMGIATGRKVDADLAIGTRTTATGSTAVNAQVVDIDDDTIIGTKEGVAYITASYETNDHKKYEASSMKITVVAQGTATDDDTTDGKTYMVTASSLRVRSGAGTNFSQIGSLKNGATVKVESIANGWAKLENGGYVSAQYLAEVVDNGEAQTMYVTARTLNVRKGPGTSYAKVGTLSRGTAVQVVGFSGNWAKLSNGYYVSTSYLAK